MTLRTQRFIIVLVLAAFAYGGSYLAFRTVHLHHTATVGRFELVIPRSRIALYFFFFPLIYLDGAATEIGVHIEP